MTIDEIYKIYLYAIGKNKSQGYLSPSDFNLAHSQAQVSYVSWLLGSFQKYTPGRPVANVELGQNRTVRQRLTPVIKKATLTIVAGVVSYPTDFLQVDAMFDSTGLNRLRYVQQDSLDEYYNSAVDPISANPIYLIETTGFQFYPLTLGSAKLSYVSKPVNTVWGFTPDGNGRPVYDAGTSVQSVFDDVATLDIIARGLRIIGVNLQAQDISQYSNELKINGQ